MTDQDVPPEETDLDRNPVAVYDRMAAGYAETNPESPPREHYEWPAVRDLLTELTGRRVLDAACGSGYYSSWLADEGAAVVGVDASEAMIAEARRRYGDAAEFHHGDLREPLEFLDAGSFDLVVCQLALEHIEDWTPVLDNFARVLDQDGVLVASTAHPFTSWFVIEHEPVEIGNADANEADYYEVEAYDTIWGEGEDAVAVPFFRRSLEDILTPVFDAGFVLDGLREPVPQVEDKFLDYFKEHTPRFIAFRARQTGASTGESAQLPD